MSIPLEAEILLFNVRCELEDRRLECEALKLRIIELENHIRFNEEKAP